MSQLRVAILPDHDLLKLHGMIPVQLEPCFCGIGAILSLPFSVCGIAVIDALRLRAIRRAGSWCPRSESNIVGVSRFSAQGYRRKSQSHEDGNFSLCKHVSFRTYLSSSG